jgi:hypothetical protein
MGYEPSTCPPTLLNDLDKYPKEKKFLTLGNKNLNVRLNNIEYCSVAHNFPHNNTLIIDLLSQEFDNKESAYSTNGHDALEKIYFSLGNIILLAEASFNGKAGLRQKLRFLLISIAI